MDQELEIDWALVVFSEQLCFAYVVTFAPQVIETEGEEVEG